MRRPNRTPPNVRVVAIGLAVLAHVFVVVLLVIERRMQRPQVEPQQQLFVSIWPYQEPPPPPPPRSPRPPPTRTAPSVPAITPLITQQEQALVPAPVVVQPVVPEAAVLPPIDWSRAPQEAANLYLSKHKETEILKSVAESNGPRKPCRPPAISKETQAKMDKLLPRPPDPGPPVTIPPGSIIFNGTRVGVATLPRRQHKAGVESFSPDDLLEERQSSVPDPFTCD